MAAVLPGRPDLDDYWHNLVAGVDAITDVPARRGSTRCSTTPSRPAAPTGSTAGAADSSTTSPRSTRPRFGIMPIAVEGHRARPADRAGGRRRRARRCRRRRASAVPDADRVGVILGRGGYLNPGVARLDQRVRSANQVVASLRELLPDLRRGPAATWSGTTFAEQLGPQQPEACDRPGAEPGRLPGRQPARPARPRVHRRRGLRSRRCSRSTRPCAELRRRPLRRGPRRRRPPLPRRHASGACSASSARFAERADPPVRPPRRRHADRRGHRLRRAEAARRRRARRRPDLRRHPRRGRVQRRPVAPACCSPDVRRPGAGHPPRPGAAGRTSTPADALGLLEAHGTATPTGDEAELATLARGVRRGRDGASAPVIGSVKSMIGHAMPAAGAPA